MRSPTPFIAVLYLCAVPAQAQGDVWRITYDLTGTEFIITNTPFGAGDGTFDVGPGSLVLDFQNDGGQPGDGPARMVSFDLDIEFTTGSLGTDVMNDLRAFADYNGENRATEGALAGGVLSWSEEVPYRTIGTILCQGSFCGLSGFTSGETVNVNDFTPFQFNDLDFGPGGPADPSGGFTSADMPVPNSDENADTFLRLVGAETGRELLFAAHDADVDANAAIDLSELLRVVQLYSFGEYHCDPSSEDGFAPGPGGQDCLEHTLDFIESDWRITLSELLRGIELFNAGSYRLCFEGGPAGDGFCAGAE